MVIISEKLARFGFKKAIKDVADTVEASVNKGVDASAKKAMSGFKKFLLVSGGATGVGGTGYLSGRLHGAQRLNTALQTYNEAENNAIANDFYNQGIMAKQGADAKSLLALGGILGLAGTGGYIGGRLHQKIRNQELVNKFNAVNPAENQEIAAAAYELGKSASIVGRVAHSFQAIPKGFRWKIMHGMAKRKKEVIQKLRESNPALYAQQHGLAKEKLYERAMKISKTKLDEAHKDSDLALDIIGTATGLTGGAVFVKNMPPKYKEKFNKVMQYASMNKEANIFSSMFKGFSKGRKAISGVAEKADKAILEKLKNSELTKDIYQSMPKPSGRVDTGFKGIKGNPQPSPTTIKSGPGVKTQTSDEALGKTFSKKPPTQGKQTIDETVSNYGKEKEVNKQKWINRIKNFRTAAAGVGIGAAGVGVGYNLATRLRNA